MRDVFFFVLAQELQPLCNSIQPALQVWGGLTVALASLHQGSSFVCPLANKNVRATLGVGLGHHSPLV